MAANTKEILKLKATEILSKIESKSKSADLPINQIQFSVLSVISR